MQRRAALSRSVQIALLAVALLLLGWLCQVAARPKSAAWLPTWLTWFGSAGSFPTIAIVVTVLVALCVLSFRSHSANRSRNVPVVVVAGLALASVALGLSSFWHCHDPTHPAFFQPLIWTVSLVKGGVSDFTMSKQTCPRSPRTPFGLAG